MGFREFQMLSVGARAGRFGFSSSRVYIRMGFGGVLMFKNFKATEKSFLDVRHNPGGKI